MALVCYGGSLYAGGWFTASGTVPVAGIARWTGSQWAALGQGIEGGVHALGGFGATLIAGGRFTSAGGGACASIAAWDGSAWSGLGTPPIPEGGLNDRALALTRYGDELVAGGLFTTAGADSCKRIARWDGVRWHPFGTGADGLVQALTVFDGDLVAAGAFQHIGGVAANRVARWDGAAWHAFSSGVGWDVSALCVHEGHLLAAGGTSVASWSGSDWQSLGPPFTGSVRTLASFGDQVVAGGTFAQTGAGTTVNYIAAWDGISWNPLGTGLDLHDPG
jgi:hypothetical protein